MIQIYFKEPRLEMTPVGRLTVRVVSYATYGLLGAAAIVLSVSDISPLRAAGFLFVLFLFHRIIRIGKPERSLGRLPKDGQVNVSKYFLPSAYRLIEKAYEQSKFSGGNLVMRLLRLIAERDEIQKALSRMDVSPKDFIGKVEQMLEKSPAKETETELQNEIAFLAIQAFSHARAAYSEAVQPEDIFVGIVKLKNPRLVKIMSQFDLEEGDLENALIFGQFKKTFGRLSILNIFVSRHHKIRHRTMNRAWTARPTSLLDRFSRDLTDLARDSQIGFMVGHVKEYDQLVDVLSRPGSQNALLIGESGSGKSTIVARLAFQISTDRVPRPLFDKRLVQLSLGSLVAGVKAGELEERVQRVVDEILKAGNIILYVPHIHNLIKSGGYLQMTIADVLIPLIKSSDFPVIGGTFPQEYKQMIEPNADFKSAFEAIRVEEISEQEAIKILIHQALILEADCRIIIGFKAIKQAVELAHRYFREKLLPGSAEDLLKEALARARESYKKVLTPGDVIAVFERRINVPIHKVRETEAEKLLDLENIIHKKIIDQDEAVTVVSQAVREYRSGLARKGGPIASFLFVGPTGVGKTELSKTLAKIQFGDEKMMLRFDMSEYQNKQSSFRLIGSPGGKTRGALTDAVLARPYSLVLLDEFEKAHPDILNLFLQVFDDGRLTDNLGRTVDFSNTIIIATSNAHSEFIKTEIEGGASISEIAERLKRKLTDYFRAELLNRFSGIIVFRSLGENELYKVAWLRLAELSELLFQNQGIALEFSDEAVRKIAELGYDPVYGARPIRRVISDKIRAVLAEKILRREVTRGANVRIVVKNEELEFVTVEADSRR